MGKKIRRTLVLTLILLISIFHFNVIILVAQTNKPNLTDNHISANILVQDGGHVDQKIAFLEMIKEEFSKIGFSVEITTVDFRKEWAPRVLQHPIDDYSIHEEGGFDLAYFGINQDSYDFTLPLAGVGYSPFSDIPETKDIADDYPGNDLVGFDDAKYLSLLNEFFTQADPTLRNITFQGLQEILYEKLPILSITHSADLTMYSPTLTPSLSFLTALQYGNPMFVSQLTSLNGPELNIWAPYNDLLPVYLTPHIFSPNQPHFQHDTTSQIIQNLLYEGLYVRDINSPDLYIPILAESQPIWTNDFQKATVSLRSDVKFNDGETVTSYDVVESYKSYMNTNVQINGANPNSDILNEFFFPDSITAIDNYTIEFNFKKKHSFPHSLLTEKILPIHIFGNHSNPSFKGIPGDIIYSQMKENGSSPLSFGTGPYELVDAVYEIGFDGVNYETAHMIFQRKVDYWGDSSQYPTKITVELIDNQGNYFNKIEDKIEYIKSGDNQLIIPRRVTNIDPIDFIDTPSGYNVHDFSILQNTSEVGFAISPSSWVEMIGINQYHPLFGTGLDTPLGKENPESAPEAANYIRKAMNHAIPRQKIVEEIFGGVAYPGILPIAYTISGFDDSLAVPEYNLTKSIEYMEMAGYEYNTSSQNFVEKLYDYVVESPEIPFGILLLAGLTGLIVYKYTTFRFRHLLRYRQLSPEEKDLYIDHAKKIVEESENLED
ncbi:MAG: hypothetical protein GPJ54_01385 [Candidatus Heimdallarchaeota archaeon]|nr:hypothetical protein [Candidatus Heimdallarchaeota archaeon]